MPVQPMTQSKIEQKLLKSLPSIVVSDQKGKLFDIPEYALAVRHGSVFAAPAAHDIAPLPDGSELHMLPERCPVGIDRRTGEFVTLKKYQGMQVMAASAFVAPAHTALHLAAFERRKVAAWLPLFSYAPLGFRKGRFVTTAIRVDKDRRQDSRNFDQNEIIRRGNLLLKKYPKNRLTSHLVLNCAFTYFCPAARNWIMGRWEAPIPTSISCNSSCLGCISKQPENGVSVTQPRLTFLPTVEEILEYAVPHLEKAARPIVSFGQGCEGEPLTRVEIIQEAVQAMRSRTKRGTINLNTNGSMPDSVEQLCRAGIDSIRVSLNSCRKKLYEAYYRPRDYRFEDVIESIRIAKRLGVWVSLNYLIFPGLTDSRAEMAALEGILKEIPIDMIQMRNHNIDPDWYMETIGIDTDEEAVGIQTWMERIRKIWPSLRYGYFNPCLSP